MFPLPATHNLVFIFMVGDGILNATLRSPVPLNDNEWHFVQAEINVKLARIKVDNQPWAVRRFPGQTFVTMKFTHPLLVGRLHNINLELAPHTDLFPLKHEYLFTKYFLQQVQPTVH